MKRNIDTGFAERKSKFVESRRVAGCGKEVGAGNADVEPDRAVVPEPVQQLLGGDGSKRIVGGCSRILDEISDVPCPEDWDREAEVRMNPPSTTAGLLVSQFAPAVLLTR